LFGSDDGNEIKESFPNYRLGYIRGQAQGYVDAIQFIWYRETVRTATATLPTYIPIWYTRKQNILEQYSFHYIGSYSCFDRSFEFSLER
jgi:hypothetical protein